MFTNKIVNVSNAGTIGLIMAYFIVVLVESVYCKRFLFYA